MGYSFYLLLSLSFCKYNEKELFSPTLNIQFCTKI